MSIFGRGGHYLQEVMRTDKKRAGAGDENPSRPQHLHGAQVELLISSERFFEVALRLGEGRWIKNDGVVAPVGGGIVSQKIEGIGLNPFQVAGVEGGVFFCPFERRT